MTPRVPRVTAKEVVKVLARCGFLLARSSGSHHIYKNREGIRVTVPVHAGKIIHPKILSRIMKDAGLTVEAFRRLLAD